MFGAKRFFFIFIFILFAFQPRAMADVTGSFTLGVAMAPEGNQTEAQKMLFDLRSFLHLDVTVSGVVFGIEALYGTFGLEEVEIEAEAQLGAVVFTDNLFFSIPYYINFPSNPTDTALLADSILRTVDENGVPNGLGFVQKRLDIEINIAGITVENTAMFEDVDFASIFSGSPVYHLDAVDSIVGNQTPTYGFGNILSLTGQTVSGIVVEYAWYLCADTFVGIFKTSVRLPGVNPACTPQFNQEDGLVLEDGAKTPLLFDRHTLVLRQIEFDNFFFNASLSFEPGVPRLRFFPDEALSITVSGIYEFSPVLDVLFTVESEGLRRVTDSRIAFRLLTVDNFLSQSIRVDLVDRDGDAEFEATTASFFGTISPQVNPLIYNVSLALAEDVGLTLLQVSAQIKRNDWRLNTRNLWGRFGLKTITLADDLEILLNDDLSEFVVDKELLKFNKDMDDMDEDAIKLDVLEWFTTEFDLIYDDGDSGTELRFSIDINRNPFSGETLVDYYWQFSWEF